jgi:hypothetical protein
MKDHPFIRVCWYTVNVLLIVSLGLVACGAAWEFSTRSYLNGFSDAIIPADDNPEQKVEAILAWMEHGPARRTSQDPGTFAGRNPQDTLNYKQLLEVCGTATNAFVNLAQSSGLHARRLLLLDENRRSMHVVAEVLIEGRWVIADPSYHKIFRLPAGQFVTRAELRDPAIFQAATLSIPGYPPSYTYDRTVHVRLGRIPVIGRYLRGILNAVWPAWEEEINWTLLVERESFATLIVSSLLLLFALALRLFLGWFCVRRFGIVRVRLRDQLMRAGEFLIGNTHSCFL